MRKRMETIYTLTWVDGTPFQGNCRKWAYENLAPGETVTSQRVLWIGEPWTCWECDNNAHYSKARKALLHGAMVAEWRLKAYREAKAKAKAVDAKIVEVTSRIAQIEVLIREADTAKTTTRSALLVDLVNTAMSVLPDCAH